MRVIFIKEYTADRYIDISNPETAAIRYMKIPELFFKVGDEADVDVVTNFDKTTSFVLTHANGKYLIDKGVVEEKKEKTNMLHVALLAAIVVGGLYLLYKK